MSLKTAYNQGQQAALRKFALETPSAVDTFIASIDQASDAPPPASTVLPQALPQTPPAIAAQPHPAEIAAASNKEGALGLPQMLLIEKALGRQGAAQLFDDVERQMSGRGGGRTGTLHIGAAGPQFQPKPKLPGAPLKPAAASLGEQAANHVITSAKRPMPGVRAL